MNAVFLITENRAIEAGVIYLGVVNTCTGIFKNSFSSSIIKKNSIHIKTRCQEYAETTGGDITNRKAMLANRKPYYQFCKAKDKVDNGTQSDITSQKLCFSSLHDDTEN